MCIPTAKSNFCTSLSSYWLALISAMCVAFGIFSPEARGGDLFVLRTNAGCIDRYAANPLSANGTMVRGLAGPRAMTRAADGCWIIAHSAPQASGSVLRFNPSDGGHTSALIDVPEGYGGQLSQPSAFAWHDGDLLVADQADGRVKRYEYPSGQWLCDVVSLVPAAQHHQIVVVGSWLYCITSDGQSKAIKRSSQPLVSHALAIGQMNQRKGEVSKVVDWLSLPEAELPTRLTAMDGQLYCLSNQGALYRLGDQRIGDQRTGDQQLVDRGGRKPHANLVVSRSASLTDVASITCSSNRQLIVLQRSGQLASWDMREDDTASRYGLGEIPAASDVVDVLWADDHLHTTEFVYQPSGPTAATPEKVAFFEAHIRPLLHAHCLECHGEDSQEGRLRLDSPTGWQLGGRSGPAIVPGKPEESLLIQAVLHLDKDLKMPPDQRLSRQQIELLSAWVRDGAIDARDPRKNEDKQLKDKPSTSAKSTQQNTSVDSWTEDFNKRLDWWSLKPLRRDEPPLIPPSPANSATWSQHAIDQFIEQQLAANGLKPSAMASDEVLLRRAAFVLTGLPPSLPLRREYLQRAQSDREAAYVWLVDELLQSPHFGEHWARHWMDVVRYTDTYGYEWDNPAKGSHEYRDYLIRAFNQDLPFDQFVVEQLAGDLLPEPRVDHALQINESLIGPMFYHLGEHRHGSSLAFNGIHQEMVNNKVDAVSKAFLATTVACARCHDHKREPISQRDYYALGAMFMTPRWVSRPVDAPGKNDELVEQLKSLRHAIRSEVTALWASTVQKTEWLTDEVIESTVRALVAPAESGKPAKAAGPAKVVMEDIEYPLVKLLQPDVDVGQVWQTLDAEYRQARKSRKDANAGFTLLFPRDGKSLPAGWVSEGDGFESGWVEHGEILVALDGDRAVAKLLERGLHSHALSSKLPAVLRMPPQHTVPGAMLSLRLAGGEYSGSLVLDENAFQNETVAFFKNDKLAWRTYADQPLKNGVTRVTIDFATASLNANFPPRTGLAAGLPNQDLGFDKRSWLSITQIASSDQPSTPQNMLDAFVGLYEPAQAIEPANTSGNAERISQVDSSEQVVNVDSLLKSPVTRSQAIQRIRTWLGQSVERWCDNSAGAGDCEVINWLLQKQWLPNASELTPALARLIEDYRTVESRLAFPRTVNSMDERSIDKAGLFLNVRGNVDAVEGLVMPAGLSMFGDQPAVKESQGSGRLEWAQSLVDPEHPLLTRVYVNRLWQWVMGEGLVPTPDDFGRLGQPPTHPELLDWLAREFVREGWSTKRLIRQMVLSQTFRESGEVSDDAFERDPANRLRHHYSTRRLEAEAIRDSLLAVSGRLDAALYGRPINPPRLVEDGAKRLFSGPVDGYGRRSLYLTMSIMAPPKFLTTFDLPDLKLPSGKRNVTSVPAQALQLMNDPLVSELSSVWSKRLLAAQHTSIEERIDEMFLTAYARLPSESERQLWIQLAEQLLTMTGSENNAAQLMSDQQVWTQMAHTVFNTKEFIYYR